MVKKGKLQEVISRIIHTEQDNLENFWVVYNDFGLPLKVDFRDWSSVSQENNIPSHRILMIKEGDAILYQKAGWEIPEWFEL